MKVSAPEADKFSSPFSLEHEISKIKIPIPLTELVKTNSYRSHILKWLQPSSVVDPVTDVINLQDEKPTIVLGPIVEERDDSTPPFYVSLNVHDKILHNCLLDSGASHNLMPKVVMEELGLEITKAYHDLFSFDSKKVKCLGVIKDLVVSLSQIPAKSLVMDIVVADIPPRFGMLLSRSWCKNLGGSLQMDLSYATIPVFGGEFRRLYREAQLAYIISDNDHSVNHPIYAVDVDLGSSIFHIDNVVQQSFPLTKSVAAPQSAENQNLLWKLYFDGASSREGAGAGVVLISPEHEVITLSYKLEFDTTNNIAEYEALLLGLRAAREMKIQHLKVHGDSELIVQQVRNVYQTKNIRLKDYINEVWDIVEAFFLSFNIVYIPRNQNEQVDSLVVATSTFKPPFPPKLKYEVEVRYMPSIPDNVKHWRVFEEDSEIKRFIEAVDDFSSIHIDQDEDLDEANQNLNFHNMIVGHKILQFPTNHIPKGLVPLEIIFYHNDVPVKLPDPEKEAEVIDCNLGTAANPKHVKLSKFLSAKYRAKYEELLKEFTDIFAWKYEDLRTFDETVIQHKIPLKENVKPFKQKLRQINPLLLPIMEKEVKKLLDAKIIVPLRYSDWIENLVPVRKKNGEIRLCVDFINLNRCSRKDNYPLPKMEHILQRVVGSSRLSMIDGFSGYNQVVFIQMTWRRLHSQHLGVLLCMPGCLLV
jgi:ribonuclease HI